MKLLIIYTMSAWIMSALCYASMAESIASSINSLNKKASEFELASLKGKTFDSYTIKSPDNYTVENKETIDGIDFTVSVIVESGKVVWVGWSADNATDQSKLSNAFSSLADQLKIKAYTTLISSVAVDGIVVMGSKLTTHPKQGCSFYISLIEKDLRIRVDMKYALQCGKATNWNIRAYSGAAIPEWSKEEGQPPEVKPVQP